MAREQSGARRRGGAGGGLTPLAARESGRDAGAAAPDATSSSISRNRSAVSNA